MIADCPKVEGLLESITIAWCLERVNASKSCTRGDANSGHAGVAISAAAGGIVKCSVPGLRETSREKTA